MKKVAIFLALLWLSPAALLSGTDTLVSSVFSGGAGQLTAGQYAIVHTIGQPAVGATAVGNGANAGGFWNQVAGVIGPLTVSENGVIVYSREGNPEGSVWVRATDGSYDSMLFVGAWPRLSHNGRYIVFHKASNPAPWFKDLYIYDLQTARDTFLYYNGDWIQNYSWSFDDGTIVFDHGCQVLRIGRDGTGAGAVFTVDCWDDVPMLKPNSWTIAFHNSFQGILLADSGGANRRVVPNTASGDYWPSWSPDGAWISFGRAYPDTIRNYFKVHPDGTGLTQLTFFNNSNNESAFYWGGTWTPDGSKLLVVARIHGVRGIYAIATDGSGGNGLVTTAGGNAVDFVGTVTGNINMTLTGVREATEDRGLPRDYQLDQGYPNPFNPSASIRYALPFESYVRLVVHNVLGQKVTTLVDEVEPAGFRTVQWNAAGLASGIYFYTMEATGVADSRQTFTRVRKMLLIR
jgi:hypothetical protein